MLTQKQPSHTTSHKKDKLWMKMKKTTIIPLPKRCDDFFSSSVSI